MDRKLFHMERPIPPEVARYGAVILAEMHRQGITLTELAARTGIPISTLSRKLRGLTVIDMLDVHRCAFHLGRDVPDLVNEAAAA